MHLFSVDQLITWSIIKFYKVHSHILYTHTVIRKASYTLHLNQTLRKMWDSERLKTKETLCEEPSMMCGALPSWKYMAQPPQFFFKSPLDHVSQHIFCDIFFFCTPPQIDSLVTPLSEAQNESYKKLPPCPEPSRVATLRTSSHALL